MRKFWAFLRISLQNVMTYRGDTIVWSLSAALTPLVSLAVWSAVLSSSQNSFFTQQELMVYFLLVYLVDVVIACWGGYFLIMEIRDGDFNKYLLKPMSVLHNYGSNNISEKVIKIIVTIISLTILIFVFFPSGIPLKLNYLTIPLFLLSALLAGILTFLLDIAISLTALWIYNADFLRWGFFFGKWFLSGIVIPIYFLPQFIYNFSLYLPFRYMLSFPVEVMMGRVDGEQLLFGFTLQLSWLLVSYILYKVIFKYGSKGYEGYGI